MSSERSTGNPSFALDLRRELGRTWGLPSLACAATTRGVTLYPPRLGKRARSIHCRLALPVFIGHD